MKDRSQRQSFLGEDSDAIFAEAIVGVAGLGGGGSHVVQQLAHVGFQKYRPFDGDVVEESNLNRLVGATNADARDQTPKLEVARRVILGLHPSAEIVGHQGRWQERPELLRECDIIFGCVDGFSERAQLEVAARRHLIPYIDIGLDVHAAAVEAPVMAGQVILSMPGGPCLRCLGFITDEKLDREAERYGAAGERPQVVWANGVLASLAVGIAVDILTDWTRSMREVVYLSYRANTGTVEPHPRLKYLPEGPCPHFPPGQVGEPVLKAL